MAASAEPIAAACLYHLIAKSLSMPPGNLPVSKSLAILWAVWEFSSALIKIINNSLNFSFLRPRLSFNHSGRPGKLSLDGINGSPSSGTFTPKSEFWLF